MTAAIADIAAPETPDIKVPEPGLMSVIKRDGSFASFEAEKIKIALTKAFLAVEGDAAQQSNRVHETVEQLTNMVVERFSKRASLDLPIHIEDIQDQVELALMRSGDHKVARTYVLYREARKKARAEGELQDIAKRPGANLTVTMPNGSRKPLNLDILQAVISEACEDLAFVDGNRVYENTLNNIFDGVPIAEVGKAAIMVTRPEIENEPEYSFVAARLLSDVLHREALTCLGIAVPETLKQMANIYPVYFEAFINYGIDQQMLDPKLKKFDLEKLAKAMDVTRDKKFGYLGLQTLYDRYFLHHDNIRYELPQAFFMRVAMGLSLNEKDFNNRAIEFYNLLSSFDYMSSTPTLFNAGTLRSQLSSCYLTTVPDDLYGIYSSIRDNAMLSKFAGGLGNDWTPVRAMGAHIQGTNGKSQGAVPFLKVANDTAVAVNQGGKRKGALCAYMEVWHKDIEEFLDLRKNTGDDRRRTHDMNTANWIPDLFMKRVHEKGDWTLFSPEEVPDLHDLYGKAFEKAYVEYEAKVAAGQIRTYKTVSALGLWRKMLGLLFETGHPWVTFKDPCNLRSPQQHVGVVHSSNLCTEITLNTSKEEIAVCNLGSVNLVAHIKQDGEIDVEKLQRTIKTAVRMLDNVIDLNYYPVPQAKHSNMKHRPIGLGTMGFQDALHAKKIAYGSNSAVEFADQIMEIISYQAINASVELAKERGAYASYEGSLWQQGILPIDSLDKLAQARDAEYFEVDRSSRCDWAPVREALHQYGIRNSNVMAIAPTATIANICGVSQSIEPTYQNLYVKSNLSGEFTVSNPYLVAELKEAGLWDSVMVHDLKYYNGSVQPIDRIPAEIKARYRTAFEIDSAWLVEAASRRQKWLDQAQSLNLYMAAPSGKKLDSLYKLAWVRGLKTTYYLRTLGATHVEKATIEQRGLNAVSSGPNVCSIEDPDCEACQ